MTVIDKKGVSLELVACCSEDGVIGTGRDIPWGLAKDMAYFKEKTLNQVLLMGSITANTFPPLKKRISLVLSSRDGAFEEPYIQVKSIQEAIDWCVAHDHTRLMVIGGGKVYRDTIQYADVVYLNVVHTLTIGDRPDAIYFPVHDMMELARSNRFKKPEFNVIEDTDKFSGQSHSIYSFTYRVEEPVSETQ